MGRAERFGSFASLRREAAGCRRQEKSYDNAIESCGGGADRLRGVEPIVHAESGFSQVQLQNQWLITTNREKTTMVTLLKIAVAGLIVFGVLSPSFTPKAENANCNCHAHT